GAVRCRPLRTARREGPSRQLPRQPARRAGRAGSEDPGHAALAQPVHEHPVDGGRGAGVGRAGLDARQLRALPRRDGSGGRLLRLPARYSADQRSHRTHDGGTLQHRVARSHPTEAPAMERQFDLVVVGTGVTSAVASRCREAGWTVAVIDSRPFGGTCALRGCVPKKILVGAAEAVQAARDLAGHGVRADGVTLAWPELMRFKRSMVDPTPRRSEEAWAKIGVEPFHGRARFVGPTMLAIGEDRLVGRRILLAAGAKPAPLPFAGAARLITSEEFLNLDRLPSRLVFVGGGYISFEFAHVAARAGAEVTIVHRASRPLEAFDPDMVDLLVKRTRELGIRVEL